MEMRHETSRRSHEIDNVVGEQIGLNRRYAVTLDAVDSVKLATQVKEILAGTFAEITDIHACYHYLTTTFGSYPTGLRHDLVDSTRATAAARHRYGAI